MIFLFQKAEPGSGNDQIINALKYVRPGDGFEAKLTFYQKIATNGDGDSPIFNFLSQHAHRSRHFRNRRLLQSSKGGRREVEL
ncbi:hypothetical protein Avbf_11825 [Armadillidium vulgare]|nr:hypothetical protein Avbf_11825 [Armadillidium vulgare]